VSRRASSARARRAAVLAVLLVLALVAVLVGLVGPGGPAGVPASSGATARASSSAAPGTATVRPSTRPTTGATRTSGARDPETGLRTVALRDLPREAQATVALIERGGPFPYAQDGVTFGNRERLLPTHPRGWYHEYTVPTPGSDDRGARRIIVGRDGGRFYTGDHYASFREIA
jgi:ribonuclease T1